MLLPQLAHLSVLLLAEPFVDPQHLLHLHGPSLAPDGLRSSCEDMCECAEEVCVKLRIQDVSLPTLVVPAQCHCVHTLGVLLHALAGLAPPQLVRRAGPQPARGVLVPPHEQVRHLPLLARLVAGVQLLPAARVAVHPQPLGVRPVQAHLLLQLLGLLDVGGRAVVLLPLLLLQLGLHVEEPRLEGPAQVALLLLQDLRRALLDLVHVAQDLPVQGLERRHVPVVLHPPRAPRLDLRQLLLQLLQPDGVGAFAADVGLLASLQVVLQLLNLLV
mmetsp:Transcript_30127/g.49076  ORF Transcript_30127/g.49076 Transcript_30127/m.49076 type:complete len:273 (-) Transcript_30127:295-1113(-)